MSSSVAARFQKREPGFIALMTHNELGGVRVDAVEIAYTVARDARRKIGLKWACSRIIRNSHTRQGKQVSRGYVPTARTEQVES
jgi:hypothetical protein